MMRWLIILLKVHTRMSVLGHLITRILKKVEWFNIFCLVLYRTDCTCKRASQILNVYFILTVLISTFIIQHLNCIWE